MDSNFPEMNDQYSQAPISKLHTDVLWHVFAINADMDNDFKSTYQYEQAPPHLLALNVLRNSSQVCQSWRELILGSSSLWACVIELRCLQQKRDEWREEVIKRAGQSFLSIKGQVVACPESLHKFVFGLLMNHWSRIRKLDIEVNAYHSFRGSYWKVLQHPAPHLQLFRVNFQLHPGLLPPLSERIFSDNAPLLQEFNLHPACSPIFRLQAPWLSHLRKLSLHQFSFTIDKILDRLSGMPLLEALDIRGRSKRVEPQRWTSRPRITLPRMTQLAWVSTDIRSCFYLLYHILPARGCIPYIRTGPTELPVKDATTMRKVLARYAQNYFTVRSTHVLCLSLYKDGFDLYKPVTGRFDPHDIQSIVLVIRCRPSSTIPLFLNSLSPYIPSSLTRLNFDPHGSITGGLPNIVELFESMSSLETLHSSPYGLRYILDVSRHHPNAVFPLVRRLSLHYPKDDVLDYEQVLPEFLKL